MTATSSRAPSRRRGRPGPPPQHLETPQVLLLTLVLVVVDVVVTVAMSLVVSGVGCTSVRCTVLHSGSVGRATWSLVVAVAGVVVPVAVAVWVRRGIRTVAVVQALAGIFLITHAVGLLDDARAFREAPTPLPTVIREIPCAEKTLAGQMCVTQPPQSP